MIAVANSTLTRGPLDEEKAAHRERNWLLIVIVLLVVLLFATIFFIPYGKTAPKNSQVVERDRVPVRLAAVAARP